MFTQQGDLNGSFVFLQGVCVCVCVTLYRRAPTLKSPHGFLYCKTSMYSRWARLSIYCGCLEISQQARMVPTPSLSLHLSLPPPLSPSPLSLFLSLPLSFSLRPGGGAGQTVQEEEQGGLGEGVLLWSEVRATLPVLLRRGF